MNKSTSNGNGYDRWYKISDRLNRVENNVASIDTKVQNIENAIDKMVNILNSYQYNSKTNWGTLAAWGTVLVSTLIYHNNLSMAPIKVVDEYQNQAIERLEKINDNEASCITLQRSEGLN